MYFHFVEDANKDDVQENRHSQWSKHAVHQDGQSVRVSILFLFENISIHGDISVILTMHISKCIMQNHEECSDQAPILKFSFFYPQMHC